MSRRSVVVVVMLAWVLAVASMVWAARAAPKGGDYNRCLATCDTVTKYYGTKRATLKTHDGDKQCWSTCDARLDRSKNAGNVQAMKAFWIQQKTTNLRANQCAQACWRKYHKGAVSTAGWRNSEPRSVACTPAAVERAAQQLASR